MKHRLLGIIVFICLFVFSAGGQITLKESSFVSPDSTYYPGVWWWWLRCPTSKEAITLDLEEMKAKKINSVQLLDFGTGGGQKKMPEYLELASSEWNEMVRFAIQEAKRLGLEFGICIATSGCAAPWVEPKDSPQKLVYSTLSVRGGQSVQVQLPFSTDIKMNEQGTPVCYQDISLFAVPEKECVALQEIIDISTYMDKNGLLSWSVPEGNWNIFRFGFTPTFRAMNEFKYLDHLRTDIFDTYFHRYIGGLLDSMDAEARSAVKYIISDSWEAGTAGWSKDFSSDFKQRRGYDILPFLPVFAGVVIDNERICQRVKEDYKQTVSDLIARHYQYQQEVAHRYGLETMCEASGPHQSQADALYCQKFSDVPMGEFWARAKTHRIKLTERFMAKEAVSAAHIYGKQIVSAEAFTSVGPQWEEDPQFLKPTADRAFCEGINQFYFHTFPHSPSLTAKPGYVYYAGTYINRNTTWWDYSIDWNTYLARSQYMLRQGVPVADVCIYYGSGIEKRVQYKQDESILGNGHQCDYVNSDVILNRMTVKHGKLCLPDGVSYEVLVLPELKTISLDVLRQIQKLVYEGATVIGVKPESSHGLYQWEKNEKQLGEIISSLWGSGTSSAIDKAYGKGRVVSGKTIEQVLNEKNIFPDLEFKSNNDSSLIDYNHRKVGQDDLYFVANLTEKPDYLTLSFRVSGKIPQIWNPVDGTIVDMPFYIDNGQQTCIPYFFDAYGSSFIVFRNQRKTLLNIVSVSGPTGSLFPELPMKQDGRPFAFNPNGECLFTDDGTYHLRYSNGKEKTIYVAPSVCLSMDATSWNVSFSKKMGGPGDVEFEQLISWPEAKDIGIKYYSGTASYRNTFQIGGELGKEHRLFLDLGELYNIAEIIINGKSAGTCWMKPFRKDISEYVRFGANRIEIKVTNLWPNRLIGDQYLPEEERYTETNISKYTKTSPLLPSGLLGPVQLKIVLVSQGL